MISILTLFLFQQTYAAGIWTQYGATLGNTHLQAMRGAMFSAPDVKWCDTTRNGIESFGATVADVDKDDSMEVFIGSCDSSFYCINGTTKRIKWSYKTRKEIYSSSALADVDKDDTMEVVFASRDSSVYCVNGATGKPEWIYATSGEIRSSPLVSDIDKDDTMEVIIGSYGGKIYSLNALTGQVKWSYATGCASIESSPAVEIDVKGNDTILVFIGSNNLYCLNGTNGRLRWSYPASYVSSSPAIADLNKDDTVEVAVGIGFYACCFNGATGAIKWSYQTGDAVKSSPAIADLDGDDTLEVLFGNQKGKVLCFNGITGRVKWYYQKPTAGEIHRGISVADLNMDNTLEVVIPDMANFKVVCLSGLNGAVLWQKSLYDDIHDITIADIDNDGCVELVVGTYGGNAVWALDDISNSTNCGCMKVEEKLNIKNQISNMEIRKNKIYLDVPNTMEANIKLYDLCGRMKEVVYAGILNEGTYTFTSHIKTNGIYFVNLSAGTHKETQKLILIK
ncbi:MAG: PQQ-binding-like beta-propeller repeat protein [bacterium]